MACSGLFQAKRVVPIPLMPLLIFEVSRIARSHAR
jgi:hypothetical protein